MDNTYDTYDEHDDDSQLDHTCPYCHTEYDNIDYEFQICHICKFDNNKSKLKKHPGRGAIVHNLNRKTNVNKGK